MHSSTDDALQQWGTEEVVQWARGLGKHGPVIAKVMKDKNVTGEDLLELDASDLNYLLGLGGPFVKARKALAALKGTSRSIKLPTPLPMSPS